MTNDSIVFSIVESSKKIATQYFSVYTLHTIKDQLKNLSIDNLEKAFNLVTNMIKEEEYHIKKENPKMYT